VASSSAAATTNRPAAVSPALVGIRKGMSALGDDSFADFGVALDLEGVDAGGDRALLENWLDAGDLVAR